MIGIDELRHILSYDPETGHLIWKDRRCDEFQSDRIWKTWQSKYAGKPALRCKNQHGYLRGRVSGRFVLAHVICYAIHYGEWPTKQIDHINGCRDDNRILNLRCVSASENMKNSKISSRNTSGVLGVRFVSGRWRARIHHEGREINLGRFRDMSDAIAARRAAEVEHGYHENHGRRA